MNVNHAVIEKLPATLTKENNHVYFKINIHNNQPYDYL